MRRVLLAAALVTCAGSVSALLAGAAFLAADLPGGLPVGNAVAALALVAAAGVAVLVGRPGAGLRRYGLLALAAAVLWLPVSAALLGNWRLNGTPGQSSMPWFVLTGATVALAASALGWSAAAAARRAWWGWRKRGATPRPPSAGR